MTKEIGTFDFYLNTSPWNRLEVVEIDGWELLHYPAPIRPGDEFAYNGKTYTFEDVVVKTDSVGRQYCHDWVLNTRDGLPIETGFVATVFRKSPIYVGPKQAKSVIVKQGGVLREPSEIWVKKDGELKQVW